MRTSGVQRFLWRMGDHEREVLEAYVAKWQDKAAASKFVGELLARHGRPKEGVADELR